jgi:FkbM family methyltransferase
VLRPGDTAVDCGANIGFTSLFFGRCVGAHGSVVAFEALPRNATAIRRNLELNRCANVHVRNIAVGSAEGTVEFLDEPNGAVGARPHMRVIKVPVTTLDQELKGRCVDFIKIDVEGHEIEVLKGARNVLSQAPALDLEVHCALFADPAKALRDIGGLIGVERYELHVQEEVDGPIVPGSLDEQFIARASCRDVVHLFCMPRGRRLVRDVRSHSAM